MKYITDLDGVYANAICSGIRGEGSSRLDLAYLFVPFTTSCSVLGTRNHFKSASVVISKENAEKVIPKLLITNSGNSNAVTGRRGYEDVNTILELGAKKFHLEKNEVLNASTGIIGVNLPMDKIKNSFDDLTNDIHQKNGNLLQQAILTTDLVEKFSFCELELSSGSFLKCAGIAKGSGMIAPNMGTMFTFLVLQMPMIKSELQAMTKEICDKTFNMMSVDTDTSTSDLMIVFANGNGEAGRKCSSEELDLSYKALLNVGDSLSKQIARDGEGASKLIEVNVNGASSLNDANIIAKSVIDSPLVKTAIHGADPNWGRVIMAIGKNFTCNIDPTKVSVSFGDTKVFKDGEPFSFNHNMLRQYLSEELVRINIDLGLGEYSSKAFGCDLTKAYIDINTAYN